MATITHRTTRQRALRTHMRDGAALAVLATLAFQLLHVAEHVIQMGFWVANPLDKPFLTPWAVAGRDLLAAPLSTTPAGGNELLHLVGNVVFFLGLVGAVVVLRMDGNGSATNREGGRLLRAALIAQGVHLAEHVLLSGTFLVTGEALGVSTLFGGAAGWSLAGTFRVWLHFILNAVPTILIVTWGVRGGLTALAHPIRQELRPNGTGGVRSPNTWAPPSPGTASTTELPTPSNR